MIPALIITVFLCLITAEVDAYRFKRNRKTSHFMNLFMALSLAGFFVLTSGWLVGLAVVFLVPLVFDPYLNHRRGLRFNYQPEKPDSLIDKMENAVFGHKRAWLLSSLLYLASFIAVLILYYKDL